MSVIMEELHNRLDGIVKSVAKMAGQAHPSPAEELLVVADLAEVWGFIAELDGDEGSRAQRDLFVGKLVAFTSVEA